MGRKPGFDKNKVNAILQVLLVNPEGIWLRRIAEETRLHPSTVSKYIDGVLKHLVDDTTLGDKKPFLRIIRLKPVVAEKLQEGKNLEQILKYLEIMNKIGNS